MSPGPVLLLRDHGLPVAQHHLDGGLAAPFRAQVHQARSASYSKRITPSSPVTSGADLKPALGQSARGCGRIMTTVMAMPQPVIARVHGVATAAGCQLVATCDLAVAAEVARFAVSGINVGLFCSTPGVALGRAMARKQAMEMLPEWTGK